MKIAVGCPVKNRAWILPQWIEHVRVAFDVVGLKPHWVFAIGVGPTGQDDGTQKIATDLYRTDKGMWTEINEPETPYHRTNWTKDRFREMVKCRNALLGIVKAYAPDYFLSVDSDILLHPCALMTLLDTISHPHQVMGVPTIWDAVGGKTFLSEGSRHITTYATLNPNGGLTRADSEGVFSTQVIMAIKLMNPSAYNVPYSYHYSGEDIGWSLDCAKAGLHLGWDGRVTSKHVMRPEHLERVDRRVGW